MPDRLPQLKSQELIRALERLGFVIRRQTGSHAILRHPDNKRIVTVPIHNKDIKRGLMFGILKQSGVPLQEFIKVLH